MRKCNLTKNIGLRFEEYTDDNEEIEDIFIEQIMNSDPDADFDLISPKSKINNENLIENLNIKCTFDCKNNFKEILKLEEDCRNAENKCLLLDYIKCEQINEILNQIEKINNSLNLMIDTIKYYEAEEIENYIFEDLNKLEHKLLKLYFRVSYKLSKVNLKLYFTINLIFG